MGMSFMDTYGQQQPVVRDEKNFPPVAMGKLPLAYMVDQECLVRIMDTETKKTLVTAPAKPGDLISLDPKAGVHIADKHVLNGPLKNDGTIGIFLDPK
jgi:hypothetical protein